VVSLVTHFNITKTKVLKFFLRFLFFYLLYTHIRQPLFIHFNIYVDMGSFTFYDVLLFIISIILFNFLSKILFQVLNKKLVLGLLPFFNAQATKLNYKPKDNTPLRAVAPYWFIPALSSRKHINRNHPGWRQVDLGEGFRLQANKVHMVMDKVDAERPAGLPIYDIVKRELYFFFKDESERLDREAWKKVYREAICSEPILTRNDSMEIDTPSDAGIFCGKEESEAYFAKCNEKLADHYKWLSWII